MNLLPPKEKQILALNQTNKLITILGIVVLISLLYLILILLSIKLYVLSDVKIQQNILTLAQQENEKVNYENLNDSVKKYNSLLSQLDEYYKKELYFSKVLSTTTEIPKPSGLFLNNYSLSRNPAGAIDVAVTGTSDTRDNLILFRKSIEENINIKNPVFSPESWINSTKVDFSLTFSIKKNDE